MILNLIIAMTNLSTTDICIPWNKSRNSVIGKDYFHNINIFVSIWLLIFGLIGNLIAILVTSPTSSLRHFTYNINHGDQLYFRTKIKKFNTNYYILRWFHLICFAAILTLVFSPILKELGEASDNILWVSKPWVFYIAHVHYPLSKTLNAYTFLIYVVYFLNQIVAILSPFRYRKIASLTNVRIALALAFIYSFAWFAPIYKWQYMTQSLVCVNSKNFTSKKTQHIYKSLTWYPTEEPLKTIWVVYDVIREIMVYIIPFALVFTLKIRVIRMRRLKVYPTPSSVDKKIQPSTLSSARMSSQTVATTPKPSVTLYNPSPAIISRVLVKRSEENRQHRRTLIILTSEFLFFMMPLCIMQISMNFATKVIDPRMTNEIYTIINLLQYAYVALTFFFNVIYNPYYRRTVAWTLKHLFK